MQHEGTQIWVIGIKPGRQHQQKVNWFFEREWQFARKCAALLRKQGWGDVELQRAEFDKKPVLK